MKGRGRGVFRGLKVEGESRGNQDVWMWERGGGWWGLG